MPRHGCRCTSRKRENYVCTRLRLATVNDKEVPSPYSEVKCRVCNRKWRTKAKYVDSLPMYKERTYGKLTYRCVLKLLRAGRIVVCPQTAVVMKQRKRFKQWLSEWITLKQTPCKDGYLFVDIKHNNCRRWIAVHRLVWMKVHNGVVPKGHDVDHKDLNRANAVYENLRLRTIYNNRGKHDEEETPF